MVNGSTFSISLTYENFNTRLCWCSSNDWWYSIFTKFNPSSVSNNPNMLADVDTPGGFGPSHIWKFRCGNCWDICTTSTDLHRYYSNTGILSLYRNGITCNIRYPRWMLLSVYDKVTWSFIWSVFRIILLIYETFCQYCTLPFGLNFLFCEFSQLCLIFMTPTHANYSDLDVDG